MPDDHPEEPPAKRAKDAQGQPRAVLDAAPAPRRKESKKEKKKTKGMSPEARLVKRQIEGFAAKYDFQGAYATFLRAKEEDLQMLPSTYNVLLHLCTATAAKKNSATLTESVTEDAKEDSEESNMPSKPEDILACSQTLLEDMKSRDVPRVEATYSELARIASTCGEPDKALEMVKEMKAEDIEPRLRSYSPALQAFCDLGKVDEALQLSKTIREEKLILTEIEYRSLLKASVTAQRLDDITWVLETIEKQLPHVGEDTASVLEQWFTSPAAATANGVKGYTCSRCTVSDEGICSVSGAKLLAVDLTETERTDLAAGIYKLSIEREKGEHFDAFKTMLEQQGPYTLLVDGANVGMYGQNFQQSGFNFPQVEKLMAYMRTVMAEEKGYPMLVLHESRVTKGPAKTQYAQNVIHAWNQAGELYATPMGSNDDWYWLYAAVVAGEEGYLVTNDEMRDHIFQMLPDPKLFYRWKARHQVRFSFGPEGVTCMYPYPYTRCIQKLPNGSWYFPIEDEDDEKWMCVIPQ